MKDDPKRLYARANDAFQKLCPVINDVEAYVKGETNIEELADAALAIRDSQRLLERLTKDLNAQLQLVEQITCLRYLSNAGYQNGTPIRTAYVTCTPDVKMMASLPKKSTDPEGYAALMKHMGVPESLWNVKDEETEAVRPHWPGMIDYLTGLARDGKPLPPGIDPDKTYPRYKLTLRAKKGGVPLESAGAEDVSDELENRF